MVSSTYCRFSLPSYSRIFTKKSTHRTLDCSGPAIYEAVAALRPSLDTLIAVYLTPHRGSASPCSLQRVNRPRDGVHHYLRWLPLAWHAKVARSISYLAEQASRALPGRRLLESRESVVQEGSRIGLILNVQEADPQAIAREANSQLNR
jgi:hypothetical protein